MDQSDDRKPDVYTRLNAFRPQSCRGKKHPCPDCFACQHCSDTRCEICLRGKCPAPVPTKPDPDSLPVESKQDGEGVSMRVSYAIEDGVLLFRLAGHNSLEDSERAFHAAFADESLPPRPNILIDAWASERHRPLSEVMALGEILCSHAAAMGPRCALVMNRERPKQLELERFLSGISLRHAIEFGVFNDAAAAEEWLREKRDDGVDHPKLLEPLSRAGHNEYPSRDGGGHDPRYDSCRGGIG